MKCRNYVLKNAPCGGVKVTKKRIENTSFFAPNRGPKNYTYFRKNY